MRTLLPRLAQLRIENVQASDAVVRIQANTPPGQRRARRAARYRPGAQPLPASLPGVTTRWFTTETEEAALSALIVTATEAIVADRRQSEDAFA